MSVCFFAFAGWELVTFLRPRLHGGRPVYRALLVSSWLGVCGLYILLALALRLVPPSSSANSLVPLAASVGLGELLPMVVACVIMAASLLGNLFGFRDVVSGLVGLRARGRAVENLVPVGWVAVVCGAGLFLDRPQELFFAVAGGSFLFIYVAACVAAARSEDGGVERAVSWGAALGGAVMIALNVRASLLPVAFLVSLAGTELARRARSAQRG